MSVDPTGLLVYHGNTFPRGTATDEELENLEECRIKHRPHFQALGRGPPKESRIWESIFPARDINASR